MSGKGAKGLSGKGAKGTLGGKGVDKDKKKPISRSARAGLQFPVGRIHRLLKVRARGPASCNWTLQQLRCYRCHQAWVWRAARLKVLSDCCRTV